jgi:hypothetical protein
MGLESGKEGIYCLVLVAHPVILATQEAEIWRIEVQSQPGQIVQETLNLEVSNTKTGWQGGSHGRVPV